MSEPRYPQVHVDVSEEESDEASAELFELGAAGVEERDGTTLKKGATPGKVTLVASFATDDEANEALAGLRPEWAPRREDVVGDAWRDEWKKHFHPFPLCAGIVVRPPWEAYDGRDSERVLELEPGRAFGTGLHETTSLVAEALADFAGELRGKPVLDVGCGSGILSLVALLLGAGSARAIDIDPDAAAVTRENAARNGEGDRVVADTTDVRDVAGEFPVVVANIESRVLVAMVEPLAARLAPRGLLVLSGILAVQVAQIEEAFASFEKVAVRQKGEWVAVVLRRA